MNGDSGDSGDSKEHGDYGDHGDHGDHGEPGGRREAGQLHPGGDEFRDAAESGGAARPGQRSADRADGAIRSAYGAAPLRRTNGVKPPGGTRTTASTNGVKPPTRTLAAGADTSA